LQTWHATNVSHVMDYTSNTYTHQQILIGLAVAIKCYIAWIPLNIASIEALDQSGFADVAADIDPPSSYISKLCF